MASTSSSAQIQYLGDLEKCGIATSNNLRELLTTCLDPVEGIKQFQSMNSIQLPSLKPVMKLLDLHGIRRTEYHEAVISDLTERMVVKIKTLGQSPNSENVHRLEQHLERCFRLYRVPRIRPIVLETLSQLPKVADRYLKLIICDKELYDQCAVTVRQQIWVKNESLFLESVEPVLNSYIHEKERQLEIHLGNCSSNIEKAVERKESSGSKNKQQIPTINTTNFFTNEMAKCRRQKRQIQELITMIGQREQLYSRLVDLIRERYLATENAHFCSLRFDLLMAAHDASLEFLAHVDPCHDFAWCLDACSKHLRTKHLDAQQLAKLKTLLDIGGKKGQQAKPIPEMAMIAGDPHILHLIASIAVKMLRDNAAAGANGHLPREMASLQLLLKILQMGLNAPKLVGGQISIQQWAALDQPELSTIFLAAFSSMLCQDVIRAELATASETVIERFGEEHTSIRKRNPALDRFLRDRPICALLWLHHLTQGDVAHCPLSATKRQHFEAANAFRYAEPLPWMMNKMAVNDPWVQLLAHKLMHSSTAMANEQLANLFIRRLFIANLQKIPSAKFHLLRLCVQHRLVLPIDLLAKSIDRMEKCAAAEEKAENELEEGQLPPAIGKFAIEFGKHKEMLIETKQLRKGENDEEEEEEEREEGELPQEDEEEEDEEEEMTNWPRVK